MQGQLRPLIDGMRCHQWLKNLFVFAAPVFGQQLLIAEKFLIVCIAFIAMCMASSAAYLFNDLKDLEYDRVHPKKRERPLASGRLRARTAIVALIALAALSLLLAFSFMPMAAGITLLSYLILNILYSLWIKYIVILDVMFIASCFVLRILLGAFAISVAPSYWLLLCTINVALFLGFAKRRAELVTLEDDATNHRRVMEHYSLAFVDQMIAIVTGATLVCYILYTVDARTVQVFGTHMLVLTVPFVMYGLFRYLYLLYQRQEGGSPTEAILLDKAFLLNITLWGVLCVTIIYGNSWIRDVFAQ